MPERRRHAPQLPPAWDLGSVGPMVGEVGFKAYNLMRMASLGLPVPQGFVLSTAWCHAELAGPIPNAMLEAQLRAAIARLELASGLGFGNVRRPLMVSVRSGAAVSMPGMMDTVLNVGLNEATLTGLLRASGDPRQVWDSYRRLLESYATVVAAQDPAPYATALADMATRQGLERVEQLDFRALRQLARDYLDIYREQAHEDFPQDPMQQLARAVRAVFRSWNSDRARAYRQMHEISDALGTAVTVQRMVFGNAGMGSGAGVAFTRDPSSGEKRLYVDWLTDAQGEDIVSGRRTVAASPLPQPVATRLQEIGTTLETEFREVQEIEFTVEHGVLYLLQTRAAKRTPLAALRIAVELAEEGLIDGREARQRLEGIDLGRIELRRVETRQTPLTVATPASLGVAHGPIALDAEAAQRFAKAGTPAVLVRPETDTGDIAGIAVAAGLLTASGGRTSHAAVVARQLGVVVLVGCAGLVVDLEARKLKLGEHQFNEGDSLCLDGESGGVYTKSPKVLRQKPVALLKRLARLTSTRRHGKSSRASPA
jgi:pyruvate,orthophosphate dikinase